MNLRHKADNVRRIISCSFLRPTIRQYNHVDRITCINMVYSSIMPLTYIRFKVFLI
jgi:hypothetical protein